MKYQSRIIFALCFVFAIPVLAAMPKEGDPPTPGCRVKNGLMEPAVVYGIKEYVDEDGKAATDYWVKLPNQPWLHKNGRAVNIPQSEFLPYGEVRMVKGPQGSQTISCERPNSGISAEH